MKIYCRSCGKLVVEVDVKTPVMNPKAFKEIHGKTCPHCGAAYSDQFNVKDASLDTTEKRLTK